MKASEPTIKYPRRQLLRRSLRGVNQILWNLLANLEVHGRENLPESGPLLVTLNHFSFVDPPLIVRITPYPIEVLAGARMPNAPFFGNWIMKLWGYLPVYRGTGQRYALRAAESILAQGGVLGIAPEGGSWATVLRPPRPGAAFLAARTGATILPVGIDGADELFPSLGKLRRARVTARIGKPYGPFRVEGRGQQRRQQLDEIGHEITRRIAELIPPEKRGYYSDDPAIREAAKGTEIFPEYEALEL
jgi:1-acyl-sn-glycerol-3-phosphate acyltransferase